MKLPPIVSPQEWEAAHQELLVEEKQLTHARDAMAAKRRRMPWMAVEKGYRFEGPTGPVSLADLFEGRRQLIVIPPSTRPDVTTYPESGGARTRSGLASDAPSEPTRSRTQLTSTHGTRHWRTSHVLRRPRSRV